MPSLKPYLRRLFATTTVLYECRNCGTTLEDEEVSACPVCESTEIAVYELSE